MINHNVKFSLLHLDPDASGRIRFKESTIPVQQFGELHQAPSLEDIKFKFQDGLKVDLVFISYRYPEEQVRQFIKEVTQTKHGQECVFIQIVKPNDDGSTLATNMLAGADGVLLEPFSVDALTAIVDLSVKVKKEKAEARERAAITFILNDIINQVDRVAFLKSLNMDVGRTMIQLRHLCEVLHRLEGDSLKLYYELAIQAFESAPLPTNLTSKVKRYSGASSRVKKAMEEKLRKEIEGDL
ncbi:MAG: hypothetical protein QY326_04585 [Bdellovibrionota bacterium]|nr:MAG: hypothetical protein QY326_04585 [Bdellovibrionota bacterium]